jgi:hypothetical protein|tara:strand:+ start:3873 stop:4103 length:231 start_codon:yes stop_codon:yes gene_type:complete
MSFESNLRSIVVAAKRHNATTQLYAEGLMVTLENSAGSRVCKAITWHELAVTRVPTGKILLAEMEVKLAERPLNSL